MQQDITNTVLRYFENVDKGDWDGTTDLMTTPFHLDYSSFGAGPAADMNPQDIISGWKTMLPGFDFTHHQLGPLAIEISGDEATVTAYVTADHQIAGAKGGDIWTVYGSYLLKLIKLESGWKLSSNIFNFKFVTGNGDLPALAQQRAANI